MSLKAELLSAIMAAGHVKAALHIQRSERAGAATKHEHAQLIRI